MDKQETDRNYENMWRQLRTAVGIGQQVPLINLVCNHTSFAQTVENIFTLSFLVSAAVATCIHALCLGVSSLTLNVPDNVLACALVPSQPVVF